MPKNILSIQSGVAYGHVGNSAASFVLQRLGYAVCRLDTVAFSNHPAHGGFTGGPTPPAVLGDLVGGLDSRGFLSRCDAALSGYLGTAQTGGVVADAVTRLRRGRPGALYCCDPVMGDHPRGLYVAQDIPELFRDVLLPLAQIATPNLFELELLTGLPVGTPADVRAAAEALLARGPALVLVTGLTAGSDIGALAVGRDGAWLAASPRIDIPAYGAGDSFTALFLARYLEKPDPARALSLAVSSLDAVMRATAANGGDELDLVAAQDALVAPPRLIPAERLA